MSPADLIARIRDVFDRTGELDWSLVRDDFEVHDHELPDSAIHRGRAGWLEWTANWMETFEDTSLERLGMTELDENRVLTFHRLRARGSLSGITLERTDAQLWTFDGGRLARMDYYVDFREEDLSWSPPGAGGRVPI